MIVKLTLKDISDINNVAKEFLSLTNEKRIIAFYGSMGAGKTTFIKAICEELVSVDVVTSPTFTLVNEYFTKNGNNLYHFDFYRINKPEEALDFGFEEYLDSGSFCFIEWPERIESLLPVTCLKVSITIEDDHTRTIEFQL